MRLSDSEGLLTTPPPQLGAKNLTELLDGDKALAGVGPSVIEGSFWFTDELAVC